MDKIFNLKIDTKNKNITTVTGLKQFDNNSVLNITLLQNSLALDLSNCTVRINFLREDERVLLYMANIDNAKEGKVSIKLSPEVLEKSGLVKADISVFDSNLLKITSATFNLRVEISIFDDTYFTDKDLDLMQQEYVREKERQADEKVRKTNEDTRIDNETERLTHETQRQANEEARKKAENTRVAEWNNVKTDANNIKNTLDTTIDTANKTNNNLKNTINAGDKLKQELNVNNYVTNEKYNAFEKKTNTQYEDLAKNILSITDKNLILYVDKNGNNTDGLSAETAFTSIQAAINNIPHIIKYNVTLKISEGDYSENLFLKNKINAGGSITIVGVGDVKTTSFNAENIDVVVIVQNIHFVKTTPSGSLLVCTFCKKISIENCKFEHTTDKKTIYAIRSNRAYCTIKNCIIDDFQEAITAQLNALVIATNCAGTNNNFSYRAYSFGKIIKDQSNLEGVEQELSGGLII